MIGVSGPNCRQHLPKTYSLVIADTVAVKPIAGTLAKRQRGVYEHAHVLTKRFAPSMSLIHRRSQKFQNDILPYEILCQPTTH